MGEQILGTGTRLSSIILLQPCINWIDILFHFFFIYLVLRKNKNHTCKQTEISAKRQTCKRDKRKICEREIPLKRNTVRANNK